jgi:beta-lactamase superfamily II metal-dependent hydrolase
MTNVTRVHFLDVGAREYGDAVLCELAGRTVLIDGAHPGDDVRIVDQLRSLLGVDGQVEVDLLVATHAHQDHIGCLPTLVENDQLRARWALVADPDLGWPIPVPDDRTGAVVAGLREEILTERTDDVTLERFLADALSLEARYRRLLEKLDEHGTVVRLGKDSTKKLRDEFAPLGLRILGPSKKQLVACQRVIESAIDSVAAVARDLLSADTSATEVDAYRRLTSAGMDALDAPQRPGPPINLQSAVITFAVGGVKLLFAGDMQFADPQVGDPEVRAELMKLREKVRTGAPYDLVKISHHGSDNAFSQSVLSELGASDLFGICAGSDSTHHPNRVVLDLLDRRRDSLKWVRTDKNGLSTITFGAGSPRITKARGRVNDPAPNQEDAPVAPPPEAAERVTAGDVEVLTRIPHASTTVRVTVDVEPGGAAPSARVARAPGDRADARLASGRGLPRLLFVTSGERLVDNVGAPAAEDALAVIRAAGQELYDALPADADAAEAGRLVHEQLARRPEVEGVVIVGGYDAVPAHRLDCLPPALRDRLGPTGDPDDFIVWSDDAYGEREGGQPAVPVSRIPDGKTPGVLHAQLAAGDRRRGEGRRGVRNRERPFADVIYGGLVGGLPLLISAPSSATVPSFVLDADRVYLMLHGDFLDSGRFWGESDDGSIEAVNLANIPDPAGRVVFTGCCWGALTVDQPAARLPAGTPPGPKAPASSIALTFLLNGATAFVGCTGAHYSPMVEPYDYFGGPMHEAFWNRLAGAQPAKALFEAKGDFAAGFPHGRPRGIQRAIEHKILAQYTCLGLGW